MLSGAEGIELGDAVFYLSESAVRRELSFAPPSLDISPAEEAEGLSLTDVFGHFGAGLHHIGELGRKVVNEALVGDFTA